MKTAVSVIRSLIRERLLEADGPPQMDLADERACDLDELGRRLARVVNAGLRHEAGRVRGLSSSRSGGI